MPGSMTEFEDASPFDEWQNAKDPVFPPAERDRPCNEVVGEGERMIEQVEEKAHEALEEFHNKKRV